MNKRFAVNFLADEPGGPLDSYDFSQLGLCPKVTNTLISGFEGVTALYRRSSRRQAWRSLKKFAICLNDQNDPWKAMRSKNIFVIFEDFLKSGLLRKTGGSHYNFISNMYGWLASNDANNSVTWFNIEAPRGRFGREDDCRRNNYLSRDDLKRILVASKKGIDEVRKRRIAMVRLEEGLNVASVSHADQSCILRMRGAVKKGVFGKGRQVEAGLISAHTPYRRLIKYLFLNQQDFIPYILYILLETQANPNGIFDLRISCLTDHAVDPLKKVIVWDKHRGLNQKSAAVTTEGAYAVPKLIREMLEATDVLRPVAGRHVDRIFIKPRWDKANCPSVQSWHNDLAVFIAKYSLPDFNFVDLRGAAARLLDKQGVSIEEVQSLLQHKAVSSTPLYLRSPERIATAKKKLIRYMGAMVYQASLPRPYRDRYSTSQGYDCNNSTAGTAPLSRPGEKCENFVYCGLCPNSIVVIDSPKHVARMLRALRALDLMAEMSRSSLDISARYKYAYKEAHEVLRALLRRVPKAVRETAESKSSSLPMISLE